MKTFFKSFLKLFLISLAIMLLACAAVELAYAWCDQSSDFEHLARPVLNVIKEYKATHQILIVSTLNALWHGISEIIRVWVRFR